MTKPVYQLPKPASTVQSTRGESLFSHLSPTDRVKFMAMVASVNKRIDRRQAAKARLAANILPTGPAIALSAFCASTSIADWRKLPAEVRARTMGMAVRFLPFKNSCKSGWEASCYAVASGR